VWTALEFSGVPVKLAKIEGPLCIFWVVQELCDVAAVSLVVVAKPEVVTLDKPDLQDEE